MNTGKDIKDERIWSYDDFLILSVAIRSIKNFEMSSIRFAISTISKKDIVANLGKMKAVSTDIVTKVLSQSKDVDVLIIATQDKEDYWLINVNQFMNTSNTQKLYDTLNGQKVLNPEARGAFAEIYKLIEKAI